MGFINFSLCVAQPLASCLFMWYLALHSRLIRALLSFKYLRVSHYIETLAAALYKKKKQDLVSRQRVPRICS